MGYKLEQKSFIKGNTENFLTKINNFDTINPTDPDEHSAVIDAVGSGVGLTGRRETQIDFQVVGEGGMKFYNECIYLKNQNFSTDNNYYFHGKIKRLNTNQTFYIKLVNKETTQIEEITQYIKTINVASGDINRPEWVDVEFIFNPIREFNGIVFELQRISDDYREPRFPKIAYLELSTINNYIDKRLIKLGVQSRPGLLMCINGEEIRVSRTGIYELKNGVITTNFFSVVQAADETSDYTKDWMAEVDAKMIAETPVSEKIHSAGFLGTNKTRTTSSFVIDYMYKTSDG